MQTMQNVSFAQLIEWSKTNPNTSKILAHIGVSEVLSDPDNTLVSIGLSEFESITLSPSGILGAVAWMSDSAYPYLSVRARAIHLREMATALQIQTDSLAGGPMARRRRKIHDGIGGLANTGAVKPEDTLDLFSGLSTMVGLQVIFVQMSKVEEKEKKEETVNTEENDVEDTSEKSIYFSSDPQHWSAEKKIHVVDYYGRWIASSDSSVSTLVEWIEDLEINGWTVGWHIDASLTKEAIVEKVKCIPSWLPEHSKLKKDILNRRLAKYNTVSTIRRIISQ